MRLENLGVIVRIYPQQAKRVRIMTKSVAILPGNLTSLTLAKWEDGRIAEEYFFLQGAPAPMMMMNSTGDSQ